MLKYLITVILLILSAGYCPADEYSLDQLVNIALENTYDSQTAKYDLKNAQGSLRSSYYDLLPSASIDLYRSRYFDLEPDEWSNSAIVSLSKSLSINDPSYFNIIASTCDRKNADLKLLNSTKMVAFNVFTKYLKVLENQTILDIQQKNLELQEKIHQQTTILYENGKKSLLDLRQSEIYLIDYSIAVKDARISLSKFRNDLFNYLNIDDLGLQLALPDFSTDITPGAFSPNLILKQKFNSIKKQKFSLLHHKLDFFPDISLNYTLYQNNDSGIYNPDDYYRSANYLSISASWDVFNLLSKKENYSYLKRSLKLQKLDLDIYRKNLISNIEVINQELQNLKSTSDMYQQKLSLAQQNLEMAQQQYQLGTIGLIDLDRNRLDLQNAQLSYNSRFYDLIRKQQELNLLLSRKILDKW